MLEGKIIWFWGLSGSGKTTLADKLCNKLMYKLRTAEQEGQIGVVSDIQRLDGDIVRQSLTKDLGFSIEDRFEHIRRVAFVADLLSRHEVLVICSFITPLKAMRMFLREYLGDRLILIECRCPLEECMRRDPKKLYRAALYGKINNMTGLTSPFEAGPTNYPAGTTGETIVSTYYWNEEQCLEQIINYLKEKKYL